jgi:hypothetical protein
LPAWLVAAALSLPLVAITAWVTHGIVNPPASEAPASALAGPAQPSIDLSADRLEERVDGAADALRADGCRRLLYWRFETPPADAEALVFHAPEGARAALEREAGRARTPGPGDEAQLSPQAVYFRRGAVYVRLFLDPGAAASPDLARRAEEIDRTLTQGGPL